MKSTSPFSRLVNKPASSPAFSITGPLVFFTFTPIAFAMMLASVVFPKPGGPLSRICSRTSPRFFAAATRSSRRSQTFTWPVNSLNIGGRSETSKTGSSSGGFMRSSDFQLLRHDQLGPARPQDVIDLVEGVPDQMHSQSTRLDQIVCAALHPVAFRLFAVIAQPHPNATVQALERKRNQLIVPQMIGVANNVRARLVYSQHHERAFLLGKRIRV